jgi:protein-S-isoprenylcysteine O-methyltransferase Ste14
MSVFFQRLEAATGLALTPYGLAAMLLFVLYVIQAEIRFGAKARSNTPGTTDRGSSIAVSLAMLVPVLGFIFVMRTRPPSLLKKLPAWFVGRDTTPGLPAIAWVGVVLGALGLALRLWAVLTLRERYTRTLFIHDQHVIERGGPYRFVRHPGYLASLLTLNGIGLASGNAAVLVASIVATLAAYAYRIHVEDAMLVAAFGAPYESYRRETGALLPSFRRHRGSV